MTEDHAAIMKSIPGMAAIEQEVDAYKKQFNYTADGDVKGPDAKDKDTPDAWVPRNEWMNRLTGIHPFNVEAPVSLLREHGFLTPPTLHYVRNHGLCPKLSWHSHTIDVSGLVNRPDMLDYTTLYHTILWCCAAWHSMVHCSRVE